MTKKIEKKVVATTEKKQAEKKSVTTEKKQAEKKVVPAEKTQAEKKSVPAEKKQVEKKAVTAGKKQVEKQAVTTEKKQVEKKAVTAEKKQAEKKVVPTEKTQDEKKSLTDKKKKKKEKKQKGRIRILPLVLVIGIIAALVICVNMFKNVIIKYALQSGTEAIFGAKCDIESVDFKIFDASFSVSGFAVANKSSPMKNLFEFSNLTMDFDLTQLLLGRFVSDEVSLNGVQIGTNRTTSGELSGKTSEQENSEPSAFSLALKETSASILAQAQGGFQSIAAQYNPETLVSGYLEKLQTPTVIEDAQTTVNDITTYWIASTPEIINSGEDVFSSVEQLIAVAESSGNDIEKIQTAITSLSTLRTQANTLQSQLTTSFNRIQTDAQTVETLSTAVQRAVEADTQLINDEIAKISSLTISDAESFLATSFDEMVAEALGEYYPIAEKILEFLQKIKDNADNSVAEEKESARERLQGRTVLFNAELPSFFLRKITFSGFDENVLSVSGDAYNISTNPDLLNEPVTASLAIDSTDVRINSAVLVDLRTSGNDVPVQVDIVADNIYADIVTDNDIVTLPSIHGNASVSAFAGIQLNGDFVVNADVAFSSVQIQSQAFDPAFVFNIYSQVLDSIDSFSVGGSVGFEQPGYLNIDIITDADEKIAQGLSLAINNEVENIKQTMIVESQEFLSTYIADFNELSEQFNTARAQVEEVKNRIENIDTELQNLQTEWENKIKAQAQAEVESAVTNAASNFLQNFF
ncbi:MAG: TIGR03545 family protein [Spirochaetales bacterium]